MDNYLLTSPGGSVYDLGSWIRADPGADFGEADVANAVYAENAAVAGGVLALERSGVRHMTFPLLMGSHSAWNGLDGLAVRLRGAARPGGAYLDIKPEGVATDDAIRFDVLTGRLRGEYDFRQHRMGRQMATLELDVQPFGYLPTMILLASVASVGLPGVLTVPGGSVIGDVPGLAEFVYGPTGATTYPVGSWKPNVMMYSLGGRPSFAAFGPASGITSPAGTLIGDAFAVGSQAIQRCFRGVAGQWLLSAWDGNKITKTLEPAYRGRHRLWAWFNYAPSWWAPILVSADVTTATAAAMASAAPIATIAPAVASWTDFNAPAGWGVPASPAYQLHDMGEVTIPAVASGLQSQHFVRFWTNTATDPAVATTVLRIGGYWLQPLAGAAGLMPDGIAQPSTRSGVGWKQTAVKLEGQSGRQYIHDVIADSPIADARAFYRGDGPLVGPSTIQLDVCGGENAAAGTWPVIRAQPGWAAVSVRYRPRFAFVKGI